MLDRMSVATGTWERPHLVSTTASASRCAARLEELGARVGPGSGHRGLSVYRHLSYAQIAQELEELAAQYPDYVKVSPFGNGSF